MRRSLFMTWMTLLPSVDTKVVILGERSLSLGSCIVLPRLMPRASFSSKICICAHEIVLQQEFMVMKSNEQDLHEMVLQHNFFLEAKSRVKSRSIPTKWEIIGPHKPRLYQRVLNINQNNGWRTYVISLKISHGSFLSISKHRNHQLFDKL